MVRVLLDTCTIAELRKRGPDAGVIAALGEIADEDLFLSVLTVGEVAKGATLLASGTRRDELTSWLAALRNRFAHRILPVDLEIAEIWGELTARAQKIRTHNPPSRWPPRDDRTLARMRVMTRNTEDPGEATSSRIFPCHMLG